jgi:hypothetical protein
MLPLTLPLDGSLPLPARGERVGVRGNRLQKQAARRQTSRMRGNTFSAKSSSDCIRRPLSGAPGF